VEARKPSISETELEVLKEIWDHGRGTVREINTRLRKRGRRWAYTTVLTLLQRLESKGYVASDKSGLAHVFAPAVSRDNLLHQRLNDLANQLCEGAATPLVLALVEGHRYTTQELQQFRHLLDRLEGKKAHKTGESKGKD
jgi:BlaI family transcriptional regulator, penicillinase repressor